jgi:hypothetical protein
MGGGGERWVVCSDKPFILITGWFALQWNLDLSIPQRSFSLIYLAPSLVPNKVPYK